MGRNLQISKQKLTHPQKVVANLTFEKKSHFILKNVHYITKTS